MKEFISYSPAMLKTFEQCQKKFEYKYINEINIPVDSSKMQLGKNIHALANYYLKSFNIDTLEKILDKKEKELWNNLKNNKYFNLSVIKSEFNITSKFKAYILSGRLDALVKDDKDNYYILDYKTGKIPDNAEFDYQTIIYLIITNKFIKKYNSLNFVYIDLKNNIDEIIKFNKDIKEKYEDILEKKISELEKCLKYNIYKKNGYNCNCEYHKICVNQD